MNNDSHDYLGLSSEDPDSSPFGKTSCQPLEDEDTGFPATKFPYGQVGILVFSNAMVVSAFQVVYPFINQMIVELGIAKSVDSAGYYSGIFDSGVALAGFATTMLCTHLSDTFGRKPALVISMIGTMVSLLFFGVASTFLGLLAGRCIGGGFGSSWTWTVSFIILGEIVDTSHSATAYSGVIFGSAIGTMISPSIGGFLARPSDQQWGFNNAFWKNHPYALPCYAGALLCVVAMIVIILGLDETLASKREWPRRAQRSTPSVIRTSVYSVRSAAGANALFNPVGSPPIVNSRHTREATDDSEYGPASQSLLPPKSNISIWSVVTTATIPVFTTSFAMSFLSGEQTGSFSIHRETQRRREAALGAIYPLWAFMPVERGGLGATQSSIGLQLTIGGFLQVLALLLYPIAEDRLGL
ncbi:major facilitator superfamily transporter [Ceratobasidium sp. AG-Ba]|nr:major facilitator superfamily transporter [Ceratobasidium sp. AG-Ba]